MGQPPDQPSEEKGLSAHEAGKFAPHGKTNYDPDAALPERPAGVTAREEEIANLLAEDLTNEQISKKTGTALSTVKSHVHNILGKIKGGPAPRLSSGNCAGISQSVTGNWRNGTARS
jgi:DNA-binding CsgD family transcriptional regulator